MTMDNTAAELERRVVRSPRVGARVCLLLAALMLVATGFFLTTPLRVTVANGQSWDCGSALSQPRDAFGKGLCGDVNDIAMSKAIAWAIGALITAAGGYLVFGAERRVETRPRRSVAIDDEL